MPLASDPSFRPSLHPIPRPGRRPLQTQPRSLGSEGVHCYQSLLRVDDPILLDAVVFVDLFLLCTIALRGGGGKDLHHEIRNDLQKMAEQTKEKPKYPPGMGRALRVALHLASKPNPTTSFIGAAYSKRLNYWGVQQQRRGRAQEAEQWFGRALALNPANLTAHINLEYAERCRRGDRTRLNVVSLQNLYSELFAKHSDWRAIVIANGPVDEPSFLFRTGRVLLAQGFLRQAIPVFARSAELALDWPAPKLWLARRSPVLHRS